MLARQVTHNAGKAAPAQAIHPAVNEQLGAPVAEVALVARCGRARHSAVGRVVPTAHAWGQEGVVQEGISTLIGANQTAMSSIACLLLCVVEILQSALQLHAGL